MNQESLEHVGYRVIPSPCIWPIKNYLTQLGAAARKVCVDIGAADGLCFSNSLYLYMNGWEGLSLEASFEALQTMASFYTPYLPQVKMQQAFVTPANAVPLLQQAGIPPRFGFLSLDIDSFDYDVLAALLQSYRPTLICAEINEKIPPPIRFRVPYSKDHVYTGDHFYGMSLASLADLAAKHDYVLIELCFNNAFLIAREHSLWPEISPAQAYVAGYLMGEIPAYNLNMDPLLHLDPQAGVAFLHEHFSAYAGRYLCSTGPEP